MKLASFSAAAAVVAASTALLLPAGTVNAAEHTVQIGPGGRDVYASDNITISVGDTVSWVLVSGTHDVVQAPAIFQCDPAPNGFRSPTLTQAGQRWNRTFATAGSYPYFCSIGDHCARRMLGIVHVKAQDGKAPTGGASNGGSNTPAPAPAAGGDTSNSAATVGSTAGTLLVAGAMSVAAALLF
ncbi:hypothetical protein THASP1DRAFT_29243 [Thamnocephalis sphaerospora]|uniref:Blue (type 1) copper domain-containing protein n=1 Tax=Thamnocephalis sphaerospora TaxID=78915 RepID=A0A4P9XTT3_9FUNG|nr:hypothetical protein THASP1DRAFT_29243 [Thamnocephalis sphaerospora]|eukprot:RKP08971.1 hypothetical protein THASP1DRAFT_29243 [Thamnocephalis sphaerospora]